MPQLGMNQDSAVILSWLKEEGNRVNAGEAIFAVETDKATVEVEAQADGFLAGIRAGEGAEVPVGDLVAMIVDTPEAAAKHIDSTAARKTPAGLAPEKAGKTEETKSGQTEKGRREVAKTIEPAPSPTSLSRRRGKRILASPKAKRLAFERGIDLSALHAQGIPEPIHAADLTRAVRGGGLSFLTAQVSAEALTGLLDRSKNRNRAMLLAAFAAGAWRSVFEVPDVCVAIRDRKGETTMHVNPDRGGGECDDVQISIVDLCDTRLTSYQAALDDFTLSAAMLRNDIVLTLSFNESVTPMAHAVALLEETAARVEDPLLQLL